MKNGKPLALDGGVPLRTAAFDMWPTYERDEIESVVDVLEGGRVNYWTGETVREFERAYADVLGVPFAIALANGTVALELGLRALAIGPGDEVIVTSRTFIASVSSIVAVGARPVFADVDADSQNVTAQTIAAVLTSRTRALMLVHLAGWPCDFDSILPLAKERGLKVIEDCAQAHGASYRGQPVGSFGDVAAFSFCQDKIITTGGEGGLLATRDESLWKRAWAFKDHGKNPDKITGAAPGVAFRWLHDSIGTNWRMTAMQAAIGLRQLRKLPAWTAKRNANAEVLCDRLQDCTALRIPWSGDQITHACYKFYAFVRPERLKPGWDRDKVLAALHAEGIPCASGSCSEVYLERAFEALGVRPPGRLPVARALGETSVMLLVHPTLSDRDMRDMAAAFRLVMASAGVD